MKNTKDSASLNEFIEKTLVATDHIINDAFALLNEHGDAAESYQTHNIKQRFVNFQKQISQEFDFVTAQTKITNEIDRHSFTEFNAQVITASLKLFSNADQSVLFPDGQYGTLLGLLSDLTALYLAMAIDLQEQSRLHDANQCALKAGVAIGKICGLQDEIRRKQTSNEYADIAQEHRLKAELEKYFKAKQSEKGKKSIAAKKHADSNSAMMIKGEIKKYWEDWNEDPSLFRDHSRFVAVLRRDFKPKILHLETVTRWTKEWSAEKCIKEQFSLYFPNPQNKYDEFDKGRFIIDMVGLCKLWGVDRPWIESLFSQLRQEELSK